jgi:hypothetical protein
MANSTGKTGEKGVKNPTIFQPGHQMSVKHGGAAGEKALAEGADFSGLAAAQEQSVRAELEGAGVDAILLRDAIRMQTVADLYYQAILGAADLDRLDTLVKRYGWIAAHAIRAWALVKTEERATAAKGMTPKQVLDAIREAQNDSE